MNILTTYFTASRLFTFVGEWMLYVEFNNVTLFTVLYSRFLNCAKDVSKVTAQPTFLECVTYIGNVPRYDLICGKHCVYVLPYKVIELLSLLSGSCKQCLFPS